MGELRGKDPLIGKGKKGKYGVREQLQFVITFQLVSTCRSSGTRVPLGNP